MTQQSLFTEQTKFDEWLSLNPEIYEMFVRFTFEAIRAGHKRLGAAMIRERLRWQSMVSEKHSGFKISNWTTPYLSRKFMADHPEHQVFATFQCGADLEGAVT